MFLKRPSKEPGNGRENRTKGTPRDFSSRGVRAFQSTIMTLTKSLDPRWAAKVCSIWPSPPGVFHQKMLMIITRTEGRSSWELPEERTSGAHTVRKLLKIKADSAANQPKSCAASLVVGSDKDQSQKLPKSLHKVAQTECLRKASEAWEN